MADQRLTTKGRVLESAAQRILGLFVFVLTLFLKTGLY